MIRDEHLVQLFRSHSEQKGDVFLSAADAIIKEALASNNHSLATKLQKALEKPKSSPRKRSTRPSLLPLPTDRRNGESLIDIRESTISEDQVVLAPDLGKQIRRLLDEHHQKKRLAEFGYTPKEKILFWGPPGCGKTHIAA